MLLQPLLQQLEHRMSMDRLLGARLQYLVVLAGMMRGLDERSEEDMTREATRDMMGSMGRKMPHQIMEVEAMVREGVGEVW